MKKLLLFGMLCILFNKLNAQDDRFYDSPGGFMDTLYDHHGNKYRLSDLRVNPGPGDPTPLFATTTQTCSGGYFNLFFNSSVTFQPGMQTILCQLFNDLSCFITSPMNTSCHTTTNTATKVNVYVTNSNTPGASASAGAFWTFPVNPASANPGLASNLVHRTIISGVDPYLSIYPSLLQPGGFYHMVININTGLTWNLNTASTASIANVYDFYTIMLHEACHALGFQSLFWPSGSSVFGTANNYFWKYDTYLRDKNNIPLLTCNAATTSCTYIGNNTNNICPCNAVYNATVPIPQVQTCSSSVSYVDASYHVPVYTPYCWYDGSSLSHFMDYCYPTTGTPYGFGNYFVMSPANYGAVYRYLKEEEKQVLCDLGYQVGSSYVSTVAGANHTYTTACNNANVWGVNDGIVSGVYQYIMPTGGGVLNIPKAALLSNDSPNAVAVTNVSSVYNMPGINLSVSASSITLSFAPGIQTFCGPILLQYTPQDINGNIGNVTYVYAYINCPNNCGAPNLCDLIQNGGFEATSNATLCGVSPSSTSCWRTYMLTPDVLDVSPTACIQIGTPGTAVGFGLTATHNGGTNHRCIHMQGTSGPTPSTTGWSEVVMNTLSTPLVPTTTYVLSFWAFNNHGFQAQFNTQNVVITLASFPSVPSTTFTNPYPTGLYPVTSVTIPITAADNNWHYYTKTFTYNNTAPHSVLMIGIDPMLNSAANGYQSLNGSLLLDDISIVSQSLMPVFSPPSSTCKGTVITNLSQYTSNGSGTMTYSGPGLINNNGSWDINTANAPAGLDTYVLSKTMPSGCTYSASAQINVIQVNANISGTQFCLSPATQSFTTLFANVTPTPVLSYSWSPIGSTSSFTVVSPPVTTSYTVVATVTAATGACTGSATTTVNVIPPITFTNIPSFVCAGDNLIYLENFLAAGSPTGGSWSAPAGLNITTLGIGNNVMDVWSAITPGTYSVTYSYTAAVGCVLTKQFALNVHGAPLLAPIAPIVHCTNLPGYATTLVVQPLPGPYSYTWTPGGLTGQTVYVSPSATTVYTVTASANGCSSTRTVLVTLSNQCCGSNNYITTGTLNSGSYNGLYAINQDITLTGTVSLTGEFLMAPNVSINVPPGAALVTSLNKSSLHLRSCGAMWNGINVQSGGQIRFYSGDVIEDAQTAINLLSTYNAGTAFATADIQLDNALFNRNFTSIGMQNYSLSVMNAMPVGIRGCVFTCRDLQIPLHALNWNGPQNHPLGEEMSGVYTAANPLSTPYTLLNYSPTTLKPPYLISSYAAIQVNNCGYTPPNGSGPYYGIAFGGTVTSGQPLLGGMNIFDNHYMGISALNSNVSCWGSTFQNSRNIGSGPGTGINAVNNFGNIYDYGSLNLVHPTNTTAGSVKFYDCQRGINATNLQRLNVGYISMMSNQTTANTPAVTNVGNMGIFISGGYYFSYSIYNSTFLNLNTGVYVGANSVTPPQLQTIFNPIILHGQWWGAFTIENNTFSSGQSIFGGPQYMSNAIAMDNINGPMQFVGGVQPLYMVSPASGLRIGNNTIDRAWRGIYLNSYNNSALTKSCVQNTITLIQDNTTGNEQYGIRHNNVYKGVIKANVISSFGTPTVNAAGVYMSMNNTSTVQCNTTSNVAVGFRFDGFNPASFWRNNYMTNHLNGLALRNTGIMGPQGSAAFASDNKWNGSWAGNNKGTYTDMNSTAYYPNTAVSNPSNSVLWVRNTPAGYYPPNNFGVAVPQTYNYSVAIQNANNTPQYDCTTNTYISGGGTVTPPGSHREVAVDIGVVQDSLGYSDPRTSEINKFNLLAMMVDDNSIIYGSGLTKDFYTNQMSLSKGTLVNAESSFITSSPSDWAALLSGISATSPLETNYLQFYNLYQNYLNSTTDSLNPDQTYQLKQLANRCPFMDGEVVYRARSLYNLAVGDFVVYSETACPSTDGGGEGGRLAHYDSPATLSVPSNMVEKVAIYPNPAQNEIYIQSPEESDAYRCSITDAQGKILGSISVITTNYQVRVELNLPNGIYFVNLVDKHGVNTNSKLVISK